MNLGFGVRQTLPLLLNAQATVSLCVESQLALILTYLLPALYVQDQFLECIALFPSEL